MAERMEIEFLRSRYRTLLAWARRREFCWDESPNDEPEEEDHDRDLIAKTMLGKPYITAARLYSSIRDQLKSPFLRDMDLSTVKIIYSPRAEDQADQR